MSIHERCAKELLTKFRGDISAGSAAPAVDEGGDAIASDRFARSVA